MYFNKLYFLGTCFLFQKTNQKSDFRNKKTLCSFTLTADEATYTQQKWYEKICKNGDVFPHNESIIKPLAKMGFKEEGRLKQQYFHQGEFKDVQIYSLTRDEYKQLTVNN